MGELLEPGSLLEGKYRIVRRLGEGGMGVVYEAVHAELHLRVAVKVLHPAEAFDPDTLARFKAEARSAASIRHPNVVEVTDYGLTPDGRPFFAMEYLNGESLADRLDRRGRLNEREVVEIADQILGGLSSAHRRGIVHRDLKPENVLFARSDDGREIVKLLDFGIAKLTGGTAASTVLYEDSRPKTQRGVVLGTPGYMAPETVTGRSEADARSDLFAVGVLLYEMLVGRRPFDGESPHEVMLATATKPVPRPTAVRPDISEPMERLVLTALAKNPADRFQTADELLRNLTAAAVGRTPADARPCRTLVGLPSVLPDPPSTRRRHQEPGSGLELDMPVSGPAPRQQSTKRVASSLRPRPTPYKGPQRTRRLLIPFSLWPVLFVAVVAGAVYYFFFHGDLLLVIDHDEEGKIHERDVAPASRDDAPSAYSASREVRIWLDLDPRDATVSLDGRPVSARPLVVELGGDPIALEVTAPGYDPQTVSVVPDIEKTVSVRLEKKAAPARRPRRQQ